MDRPEGEAASTKQEVEAGGGFASCACDTPPSSWQRKETTSTLAVVDYPVSTVGKAQVGSPSLLFPNLLLFSNLFASVLI